MLNNMKSPISGKRLIILIMFCFSAVIIAQNPNWTSVKETDINVSSALSFDVFTNQDGNHIIVQESNSLKYYRMNVNGIAGSPVTLESNTSVVSPSIAGDATRLYVVYRKSSESVIRTKYSVDGGITWLNLSQQINESGGAIESVMSNGRLHVTYQLTNQVKYSYNNLNQTSWTSPFTVSGAETGTSPRIAAWTGNGEDKVYFIYRNSITTGKFREYNLASNQWSSIYTGYTLNPSNLYASEPVGFTVGSDRIYYYYSYTTYNPYQIYFQYRILTKNGGYISQSSPEPNQTYRIHTTTTFNGTSYTAFWYNFYLESTHEPGLYRAKNLGTQFNPFDQVYWNTYQEPVYYPPVNLSSAGNDVHVIWKDNLGLNNGNNLRYIYDDQIPLAPQNYAVSVHQSGSNKYPKLTWSLNSEPDVRSNASDAYKIERRTRDSGLGAWSAWSNIANLGGTVSSYIDYTINTAGNGDKEAEYKITAIDLGDNVSPSQSIVIAFGMGWADKISVPFTVNEYSLAQNYPNPFNPTTSINFQIKEQGFVSLKIFDMLGREIADLVNETKDAGKYTIEFNANNLPSGIYIYSIRVNEFVQTEKMTLLK